MSTLREILQPEHITLIKELVKAHSENTLLAKKGFTTVSKNKVHSNFENSLIGRKHKNVELSGQMARIYEKDISSIIKQ